VDLKKISFVFLNPTFNSHFLTMKPFLVLTFILSSHFVNGQANPLRLPLGTALPKDSSESKNLTSSINNFLSAALKPNEENKYILASEKVETFILLDEINGVEKSAKFKDDFFFKPYLTNVVPLKDKKFLIQVSYIGINEGTSYLRASFTFIAHKENNSFVFSSLLLKNTENWKVDKSSNNTFHYKNTINKPKVKEFNKLAGFYDSKLKSTNKTTDYFCCDNIIELQRLIGVDYKSDYYGRSESVWSSSFGDRKTIVLGNNNSNFTDFDTHDLFHDRLSLVIARNKVNRPVDEGCAYLYGGSWGLPWKEIFKAFNEQVANNKSTNWLEIKETPIYFKTNGFNNSADYIVNALLIQKIEKEKGFAGVWELLNVGPFEKGNEKYFQILEKLLGITKANYNDKVWELIIQNKLSR